MNNLTSLFKEAVLITNDGGLYHGIAYSNNKYMDSTSTVTILIGSEKHIFKLKDVASIAVKKYNGKFYSLWYKDHVYRVDPTSDIYQEVASLF